MCLSVDKKKTAYAKRESPSSVIWCWKVLRVRALVQSHKLRSNWTITSPLVIKIESPILHTEHSLSTNELSVSAPIKVPEKYIEDTKHWGPSVYEGIHAYINKPPYAKNTTEVVWVKCFGYVKDLIAVGDDGNIAFTRLYIEETYYQKLLNLKYGAGKYEIEYVEEEL